VGSVWYYGSLQDSIFTEDTAFALAFRAVLAQTLAPAYKIDKQQHQPAPSKSTLRPPKVSPEGPHISLQYRSMAFADSPDAVINAIALNRLDNLKPDEYIIALGPDGRQFLGTPNGYSA
jgi:hypothetical protein